MGALLVQSCKSDDPAAPAIAAADFTGVLAENPEEGTTIGNISASEAEEATFEIVTSAPSGAIALDALTGEMTVADVTAFDFETRQTITATVNVSNGESEAFSNVTITITDADDILTLLTTSRSAYENETSGWVQITEAEYNLLAERMADTYKVGVPDFDYGVADGEFIPDITISNSTNITIPFDSYFFAFRYTAMENVPLPQVRPKVSEQGPITGFVGRGPLPPHAAAEVFFVSKGEQVRTTSSASYLALYSPYRTGWVDNSSNTLYYRNGNGSDLPLTATPFQALQQGLTTTIKQWD